MIEKIKRVIKLYRKLIDDFEASKMDTIVAAVEMIVESLKQGGCIYLCGNGGSAADCQHIAGEFVGRFLKDRKALAAVSLSTDTSVLTCIGNDYSFEDIFARQVEALVKINDILWVFSTSGSSANILKAVKLAHQKKAKVLAFTGKKESELERNSDVCLYTDTERIYLAQQIHQLAYHLICELVESQMFES